MHSLLETGLWNALVATILGATVAAVAMFWRRPHAIYCLWVIVLLKLITPPVVRVEVVVPAIAGRPVAESTSSHSSADWEPASAADASDLPPGESPSFEFPAVPLAAEAPQAEVDEPAAVAQKAGSLQQTRRLPSWRTVFALVWLAGTSVWFAIVAARIRRFRRVLKRAPLAPLSLRKQGEQIARRLGLRRRFEIRVAEVQVPPLLWAMGGRPMVLLPGRLLSRLNPEQQATLLAHELAHLRRRDHWVRWLELIAVGLYWWHPVAWFARRQLQRIEEQCCDAWVVWALPAQAPTYAKALLKTLDFLSESRPAVPAAASGFAQVHLFQRRLTMILHDRPAHRLPWSRRLPLVLLGLLVLALSPHAVAGRGCDEQNAASGDGQAAKASPKRDTPGASLIAAGGEAKYAIPEQNLQIPEELQECANNLRKIHAALKRYEKDRGKVPDWLSELVPDYLSADTLLCGHDAQHRSRYWPDPKLPCSYCYELSPSVLRGGPPLDRTMRHYKVLQRGLFGDVVPIVRCFHHDRVLNLPWSGQVYTSSVVFEYLFIPDYTHAMLLADKPPQPKLGATSTRAPEPPAAKPRAPAAEITIPEANLQIPEEMKPCAENLRKVYAALEKYKKDKGDLPNLLSDLVPDYSSKDALLCPTHPESRPVRSYAEDPNLPCSYGYQYSNLRSPAAGRTYRQWKSAQRRLFGDVVPVVRCYGHGQDQRLNLAFNGQIYTSDVSWERMLMPSYWPGIEFAPPESVPAKTRTQLDYQKDLEAFIEEIDAHYPFFDLKGIRDDWESTGLRLREEVKAYNSDEDFLKLILQAVRCLRDGHLGFIQLNAALPPQPPKYYPGISFLPATEERVVLMSDRADLDPDLKTGRVVAKIDGQDARRLLEERAKAAWEEGGHFSSPQRARLYEFRIPLRSEKKGEKHTITILVDGKERDVELASDVEARGWPHVYNLPDNLTRPGGSCAYTTLASGVGYVYLRRIDGSTGPGLKEAFKTYPDAKGWIVDLRGNGGGGYDEALFEVLRALPRPLAVIIDAGCISAGETMARDLVRYGNARLFGSPTAGCSSDKRTWTFPSGIATMSLPNRSRWGVSGQPIEFNGIRPDVLVEAVPEEVQQGLNSATVQAERFLTETVGDGRKITAGAKDAA